MKTVKDGFLDKLSDMYDKIKSINELDKSGNMLTARVKDLQLNAVISVSADDIDTSIDILIELTLINFIMNKEVK